MQAKQHWSCAFPPNESSNKATQQSLKSRTQMREMFRARQGHTSWAILRHQNLLALQLHVLEIKNALRTASN